MKVADLKAELTKKGVAFPSKAKKEDLVALYLENIGAAPPATPKKASKATKPAAKKIVIKKISTSKATKPAAKKIVISKSKAKATSPKPKKIVVSKSKASSKKVVVKAKATSPKPKKIVVSKSKAKAAAGYASHTVAKLKEMLAAASVDVPPKALKADLVKLAETHLAKPKTPSSKPPTPKEKTPSPKVKVSKVKVAKKVPKTKAASKTMTLAAITKLSREGIVEKLRETGNEVMIEYADNSDAHTVKTLATALHVFLSSGDVVARTPSKFMKKRKVVIAKTKVKVGGKKPKTPSPKPKTPSPKPKTPSPKPPTPKEKTPSPKAKTPTKGKALKGIKKCAKTKAWDLASKQCETIGKEAYLTVNGLRIKGDAAAMADLKAALAAENIASVMSEAIAHEKCADGQARDIDTGACVEVTDDINRLTVGDAIFTGDEANLKAFKADLAERGVKATLKTATKSKAKVGGKKPSPKPPTPKVPSPKPATPKSKSNPPTPIKTNPLHDFDDDSITQELISCLNNLG